VIRVDGSGFGCVGCDHSGFGDGEGADGLLALFAMSFEVEAIGEEVLEEGLLLVRRDGAGSFCFDVIAIGIEPFGAADDLVVLDAPGCADEGFERRVGDSDVAGFGEVDDGIGAAAGIGVDGGTDWFAWNVESLDRTPGESSTACVAAAGSGWFGHCAGVHCAELSGLRWFFSG
jgi:hypothetical protein